jgi:hypothetical protein
LELADTEFAAIRDDLASYFEAAAAEIPATREVVTSGPAVIHVPAAELHDLVVAYTAVPALVRGRQGQNAGTIALTLPMGLPSLLTVIRLTIEAPGVTFSGLPVVTFNRAASDARLELAFASAAQLVTTVSGDLRRPTQIVFSSVSVDVSSSALLGAVAAYIDTEGLRQDRRRRIPFARVSAADAQSAVRRNASGV